MKSKIVSWCMLDIIAVVMYLNVGWALGTYYHDLILRHEPQTIIDKVMAGWYVFTLENGQPVNTLQSDQVAFMFLWPVVLVIIIVSWIAAAGYWLFWLIFAGGIAKILGVG